MTTATAPRFGPYMPPTTRPTLLRPWTEQQARIADGIDRELSYSQIAEELGISKRTVEGHVRQMGYHCPEPRELPPRWRILSYVRWERWTDTRTTEGG